MAVDNPSIIDFISISPDNEAQLAISDHLNWDDEDHIFHLQNKINSYLEVIENNQIYEIYPEAIGKELVIKVALKYKPTKDAIILLNEIADFLKSNNFNFDYSVIK
jgi:type II secretory pathway component GspD/PulD (secretin)